MRRKIPANPHLLKYSDAMIRNTIDKPVIVLVQKLLTFLEFSHDLHGFQYIIPVNIKFNLSKALVG